MSGSPASDRLRWAVDRLDIQPQDRVLELGCGHAGATLATVRDHLADGGALYVVEHSLAGDRVQGTADAIALRLREHAFAVDAVVVEPGDLPAVCVVASACRPR